MNCKYCGSSCGIRLIRVESTGRDESICDSCYSRAMDFQSYLEYSEFMEDM